MMHLKQNNDLHMYWIYQRDSERQACACSFKFSTWISQYVKLLKLVRKNIYNCVIQTALHEISIFAIYFN